MARITGRVKWFNEGGPRPEPGPGVCSLPQSLQDARGGGVPVFTIDWLSTCNTKICVLWHRIP